jgi:hypothetical protein
MCCCIFNSRDKSSFYCRAERFFHVAMGVLAGIASCLPTMRRDEVAFA